MTAPDDAIAWVRLRGGDGPMDTAYVTSRWSRYHCMEATRIAPSGALVEASVACGASVPPDGDTWGGYHTGASIPPDVKPCRRCFPPAGRGGVRDGSGRKPLLGDAPMVAVRVMLPQSALDALDAVANETDASRSAAARDVLRRSLRARGYKVD